MSLAELWSSSRSQLEGKLVQQIIAFAGAGQLTDGSPAAAEFREFLELVPSNHLSRYSDECLRQSFTGSGFALQDVVNQIGRRLGYSVVDGRYRGTANQTGFDGLWTFPDGHTVVIEVKTTDTYRIDLQTLADYKRELIEQNRLKGEHSSILIVVGRQDTGDLEAQIRGSRHAWDTSDPFQLRDAGSTCRHRLRRLQTIRNLGSPDVLVRISSLPEDISRERQDRRVGSRMRLRRDGSCHPG